MDEQRNEPEESSKNKKEGGEEKLYLSMAQYLGLTLSHEMMQSHQVPSCGRQLRSARFPWPHCPDFKNPVTLSQIHNKIAGEMPSG